MSRRKETLEVKHEALFLVSKVLSFRLEKQKRKKYRT